MMDINGTNEVPDPKKSLPEFFAVTARVVVSDLAELRVILNRFEPLIRTTDSPEVRAKKTELHRRRFADLQEHYHRAVTLVNWLLRRVPTGCGTASRDFVLRSVRRGKGENPFDDDLLREVIDEVTWIGQNVRAFTGKGRLVSAPPMGSAELQEAIAKLPKKVRKAAAFIIREPGASAEEICDAVEYSGPSSFSRAFNEHLVHLGFYHLNGYRPPPNAK